MDLFLEMPEIGEINSLTLQSLQTHCNLFNFKEIGKIDGNCHQDDHALSWCFIQRMTRLASSQHKCWVIAFLSSSIHIVPESLTQFQQITDSSYLQMYSFEVILLISTFILALGSKTSSFYKSQNNKEIDEKNCNKHNKTTLSSS